MAIILKCALKSGSAAFGSELIEGYQAPERRYAIENNEIMLDGYDDIILAHDAADLLAQPDGLYRALTPKEQNALAKAKQEDATVEEQAPTPAPAKEDSTLSLKKQIGG